MWSEFFLLFMCCGVSRQHFPLHGSLSSAVPLLLHQWRLLPLINLFGLFIPSDAFPDTLSLMVPCRVAFQMPRWCLTDHLWQPSQPFTLKKISEWELSTSLFLNTLSFVTFSRQITTRKKTFLFIHVEFHVYSPFSTSYIMITKALHVPMLVEG